MNAIERLASCLRDLPAEQRWHSLGMNAEDALSAVDALYQAAKAKRAHDHAKPVLFDDQTYESWARENMALGQAVDAAVRRVDGEA